MAQFVGCVLGEPMSGDGTVKPASRGRNRRCWRALVLVPFVLAGAPAANAAETLDALKASELVASKKVALIDVRSASERAAFGVPKGAISIEWKGAEATALFLDALHAAQPDKAAPIAFICSVGHRSGQAARLAERDGYSRVYDIAEGVNGAVIGPGWRAWGLPTERSE